MGGQGISQIVVYAVVLIALAYPLGMYMARVFGSCSAPRFLRAIEGWLLPARPHRPAQGAGLEELRASRSSSSASLFSGLLFALQRLQGHLFLNPDQPAWACRRSALNTTASFVTNTNWQYYGGEYDDVVPDADGRRSPSRTSSRRRVGIAVLVAFVRGIARRTSKRARQLLGRPLSHDRVRPAPAGAGPRADPDLPGRAADVRRARDGARRSKARCRRSRAGLLPRRSRSSSWARTAAASGTRTRRCRSRTRTGSRTSSRCSRSC